MKRNLWLVAVWFFKILLAKKNMKTPFFKGLYYNIFGGFTSDQVCLYGLNKKNKDEFLSEFDWYKSRKINGKYAKLLNDKVKFNEIIKEYINVPEIYIVKKNNTFFNKAGKEINLEECIKIIKKNKSVFIKPISKGKGIGVRKIEYKDNKFYLNLKKVTTTEIKTLLINENNLFISETINQAKYLNKIYDKTSNTIRIITVRQEEKIKILFAVQRFGDKNSIPVDNGSMGGIVAKIDLNTGILSSGRSIKNKNIYKYHPDSKEQIEGTIIPNFNNIKDKVIKAMENLNNIDFIAWDILVTDKDIYTIEANASSGVNIIQVFGGQRKDVLGDFYRSKRIIK